MNKVNEVSSNDVGQSGSGKYRKVEIPRRTIGKDDAGLNMPITCHDTHVAYSLLTGETFKLWYWFMTMKPEVYKFSPVVIAKHFNVNERTVQRSFQSLVQIGYMVPAADGDARHFVFHTAPVEYDSYEKCCAAHDANNIKFDDAFMISNDPYFGITPVTDEPCPDYPSAVTPGMIMTEKDDKELASSLPSEMYQDDVVNMANAAQIKNINSALDAAGVSIHLASLGVDDVNVDDRNVADACDADSVDGGSASDQDVDRADTVVMADGKVACRKTLSEILAEDQEWMTKWSN